MIAFVKGTVASYGVDYVVVENQGMGWQISYPHCDELTLQQEVKIYTYMHITEQDMSLFGFVSQEEKELFLRLISVKGLGPKTAMNMLAKAGYQQIIQAIESGDVTLLKKMPGIGAKSASQIVLDLKGKLVAIPHQATSKQTLDYPLPVKEAIEGLKSLGYKQGELNEVVNTMIATPGLKTEEYLKLGLRLLQKQKL